MYSMKHPVVEACEKAAQEAAQKTREKTTNDIILHMIKNGMTKDQILKAVSEEEYERALKLFKEDK